MVSQIPIYTGTTVGILKYPDANDEREYYFGYEGYGETGYQGPSIDDLPKYHAVLAIIDAVKKYPGICLYLIYVQYTHIQPIYRRWTHLFYRGKLVNVRRRSNGILHWTFNKHRTSYQNISRICTRCKAHLHFRGKRLQWVVSTYTWISIKYFK